MITDRVRATHTPKLHWTTSAMLTTGGELRSSDQFVGPIPQITVTILNLMQILLFHGRDVSYLRSQFNTGTTPVS